MRSFNSVSLTHTQDYYRVRHASYQLPLIVSSVKISQKYHTMQQANMENGPILECYVSINTVMLNIKLIC